MDRYRNLTQQEISILLNNGCKSDDWSAVEVESEGFTPENIVNTVFSGSVKIGSFSDKIEIERNVFCQTGIYNAHIHNCQIGSNTYIRNISGVIANYNIADKVIINDCGTIITSESTSFGNGTRIAALNESGCRAVPMYDNLSAQIAYLLVMYRHDNDLYSSLCYLIDDYTKSITSNIGSIGTSSVIKSTKRIENVKIGEGAIIENVTSLTNGSINSIIEAPTIIRNDVIAHNFIISSGSELFDAARISNTFIGQGSQVGVGFTSENSLFFSNCQAFNGESCSIVAGPYTVTHHKSTLLIGGMFSFYNAGSATNQSNHNYKLGPLHQGIFERGVKTGSGSYVLLPAHAGAFSMIVGKHYSNFDTQMLPFSYILEKDNNTYIIPGVGLQSVGIYRDVNKWKKRDNRSLINRIDRINFDNLNPKTVANIQQGLEILQNILAENSDNFLTTYNYNGCKISKSAAKRGITIYQRAIDTYIGWTLTRLKNPNLKSSFTYADRWIDVLGMYTPIKEVEQLVNSIKTGKLTTIEQINKTFDTLYHKYLKLNDEWAKAFISNRLNTDSLTPEQQQQLISKGESSSNTMFEYMLIDAKSEFSSTSKISYGITPDHTELDFQNTRSDYDSNPTVIEIKSQLS